MEERLRGHLQRLVADVIPRNFQIQLFGSRRVGIHTEAPAGRRYISDFDYA